MPVDTEDAWTVDVGPAGGSRVGPRTVQTPLRRSAAPPTIKARRGGRSPRRWPCRRVAPRSNGRSPSSTPATGSGCSKCGLGSPDSFLALAGDVVCGHPDRHVARVELHAGVKPRVAYLKREHVGRPADPVAEPAGRVRPGVAVRAGGGHAHGGWKEAGQPGPQWMAYGEHDGQSVPAGGGVGRRDRTAGATWTSSAWPKRRPPENCSPSGSAGRSRTCTRPGSARPNWPPSTCSCGPDVTGGVTDRLAVRVAQAGGRSDFEDRYPLAGSTPRHPRRTNSRRPRPTAGGCCAVVPPGGETGCAAPTAGRPEVLGLRPKKSPHVTRERVARSLVRRGAATAGGERSPRNGCVWLAGEAVVVTPELIGLWPKPGRRRAVLPRERRRPPRSAGTASG